VTLRTSTVLVLLTLVAALALSGCARKSLPVAPEEEPEAPPVGEVNLYDGRTDRAPFYCRPLTLLDAGRPSARGAAWFYGRRSSSATRA
jgi:hypothetical protein